MKAEICALPVSCSQCGTVFDLSYDVARLGKDLEVVDVIKAVRAWRAAKRPLLCWDCRT